MNPGMTYEPDKIFCDSCHWKGRWRDVLTAPNPFCPGEHLQACPHCREVENFRCACDEPGCWEEDTQGYPVEGGYRRTCHQHGWTKKP